MKNNSYPKPLSKPKRNVDAKLLKEIRKLRCLGCKNTKGFATDPAHIKTRGSGGHDHWNNVLPLCRACHTEQGAIGWRKFVGRYPVVGYALKERGWEIDGNGKLIRELCTELEKEKK